MRLTLEPQEEICLLVGNKYIRQSRLYQLMPNEYFSIEQTDPLLKMERLNEIVLLTYLTNKEKPVRLGFEARIKAITPDGRVILHKLNDPAPCDLRNWPRISRDLLPCIRATCQKKESQVIDISSNGVHLILYEADAAPKIGSTIKLNFIFDTGEVDIEGKILRGWKDNYQRTHMAVFFDENNNISKFIY